jgi:hypothetical protein
MQPLFWKIVPLSVINTYHDVPMPHALTAVSFMKVHVVAGKIGTASQRV